MICVFDCETVPDASLIRATSQFASEIRDKELSLMAMKEQESKTGSGFLPVPFHQVVAISAVIADDYGRFSKVSSIEGACEKEMIENFLGFIDRYNPRLVSFNGRGFDIPMLFIRALKYNLSCPAFFEQENHSLNKTRWDNYRSRYSEQFHLDLLEVFGHYGAVRGLKLDTVCAMAGVPGKYDVSGDQVLDLYYDGELDKIKEYCESDVLNTYILFLKYELLKGNLTIEDYREFLGLMSAKLPRNRGYYEIFSEFVEKEVNDAG